MATIKANGGAASVWEHRNGLRIVLCRNGKVLAGRGGTYRHTTSTRLSGLIGRPLAEQEETLQRTGFARAAGEAQVRASTAVAAYAHQNAKRSRRLRQRREGMS